MARILSVETQFQKLFFNLELSCRRRILLDFFAQIQILCRVACAFRPIITHCVFSFSPYTMYRYWLGSDLKTANPATGEAEKGCLYYPQPPPGHGLYPSRKTYGKQKFIELEKLHNCTFVSGDFMSGGDITFVLNMLVTQREVQNFRSMVRDVNVAGNDTLPVANKRGELIVSKRPNVKCEECEAFLDFPIQHCSCCGAARCSSCMSSVCRIPGYVPTANVSSHMLLFMCSLSSRVFKLRL
jgi:hypothetical protein